MTGSVMVMNNQRYRNFLSDWSRDVDEREKKVLKS